MSNIRNVSKYRGFRRDFTRDCSFNDFRKTQSKKTTASRPFLIIMLGSLIGLDRY